MDWLFDHAIGIDVLLGMIALGFVVASRKTGRVKYLAYAGGVVLLIALFWLLSRFVVTDQQQIHQSIEAIADGVMAQNADAVFKHVATDFKFQNLNRQQMFDAVAAVIKLHKLQAVVISNFRAEEISRAAGKARVSFLVRVDDADDATVFFARCEAEYVLEGDHWKVRRVAFFNPVANQDQPMPLPLP